MAKKTTKDDLNDIEKEKEKEESTNEIIDEEIKDPKDIEIAKLKDQMLRQLAEYDNYRKRTAKERLEITADTISKTVTEFLPVIDNLERALNHTCTDENFKKGVEMIYESFIETLGKLGVETIETDGKEFNPSLHQAVQQVESDEMESGLVFETFQKGYKIGEKIIRFAMVAVVN